MPPNCSSSTGFRARLPAEARTSTHPFDADTCQLTTASGPGGCPTVSPAEVRAEDRGGARLIPDDDVIPRESLGTRRIGFDADAAQGGCRERHVAFQLQVERRDLQILP